jgi:hypothetical protein
MQMQRRRSLARRVAVDRVAEYRPAQRGAVDAQLMRAARPPGAGADRQILRPPAALPPSRDLCPRRCRAFALDRGRMGGGAAFELRPLVAAIAAHVLAADKLHGDDTPVKVLAPGTGKTKTGRLWVFVRDEGPFAGPAPPAALYRYSEDRKGEHPRRHLESFRGIRRADGYAGFNELYASGERTEVACWAHVRRKFFDIHASNGSPLARETLERIATLYGVESQARRRAAESSE